MGQRQANWLSGRKRKLSVRATMAIVMMIGERWWRSTTAMALHTRIVISIMAKWYNKVINSYVDKD